MGTSRPTAFCLPCSKAVPGPESLIPFAAFWLVAVLTPGPNMLLFTWLAVSKPRPVALSCVGGIQSAMLIWAISGLFGLAWFIESFPSAFRAVAMSASYYLICLWLFTRPGALALYARSERYITGGAGIIFAIFGLQLLASGLLTA